ncbi:MAG: DUF4416 family protein [Deltaproteobacteria bacterium]|nr:DUF4416 family protein [Deltaproteobacteria bacterium]
MSRRTVPSPVTVLVSVLYRDEETFSTALERLAERFGPIASVSGPFPFDRTDYYEREMGPGLLRRFVVFEEPAGRDALVRLKIAAEELENAFSTGGRRSVNIDPGILTDENFVLATGKNHGHRIYLGEGVFADLTLVYRKGEYRPLPWTYPDYAGGAIRSFLGTVRADRRESRLRGRSGGARACG